MMPLRDDGPVLAISPHLDDAVMGVGGTLAAMSASGRHVVVCTVFAGEPTAPLSPVAQAFHDACGLDSNAVSRRREEDRSAAATIGAEVIHLPFLDAIYRRHAARWLCETPRAMFDTDQPDESALQDEISKALDRIMHDMGASTVLTCAAIGEHVDHRHTRRAVAQSARRHGWNPVLWEDLPYPLGLELPIGVEQPAAIIEVTEQHLSRKIDAIGCYPSQLRMLFEEGDGWRTAFLNHAKARRALGSPEALWWMPL